MLTTIWFEPPAPLINLNQRLHWAQKSKLTKAWRAAAAEAARAGGPDALAPSLVEVLLPVRDKRRRDPHNYVPTLKAIVDGLVDAGLWPDDNQDWVRTLEPKLMVKAPNVVVNIESLSVGERVRGSHAEHLARVNGLDIYQTLGTELPK